MNIWRWIKVTLTYVLSGVVFLLCLDAFVFFVLDIKPSAYEPRRFFATDALLGHFHVPNARGYWYRYIDGSKRFVEINKFGFSDSPREVRKERPRIALVGDSTTENWEVDEPYRCHNVLEKLLKGKWEVLNMGVRGYGTDQSLILLEHLGIQFSPDIVVHYSCSNDFFNNGETIGKPFFLLDDSSPTGVVKNPGPIYYGDRRPFDPSFVSLQYMLEYYSFSFRILRQAAVVVTKPIRRPIGLEERFDLIPYLKQPNEDESVKVFLTLGLIGAMNDFCKQRGVKFVVVQGIHRVEVDKAFQRYLDLAYGPIFDYRGFENLLSDYCKKHDIVLLSLNKEIRNRGIDGMKWFFHQEDDVHLNSVGIRDYCRMLADFLTRNSN